MENFVVADKDLAEMGMVVVAEMDKIEAAEMGMAEVAEMDRLEDVGLDTSEVAVDNLVNRT